MSAAVGGSGLIDRVAGAVRLPGLASRASFAGSGRAPVALAVLSALGTLAGCRGAQTAGTRQERELPHPDCRASAGLRCTVYDVGLPIETRVVAGRMTLFAIVLSSVQWCHTVDLGKSVEA